MKIKSHKKPQTFLILITKGLGLKVDLNNLQNQYSVAEKNDTFQHGNVPDPQINTKQLQHDVPEPQKKPKISQQNVQEPCRDILSSE